MKKLLGEFFGTFLLIFLGTGLSVLNDVYSLNLNLMVFAGFWGALVVLMIFLFMNISGAHLNPAVTLALFLDKKIEGREIPLYLIGQFTGSLVASIFLWLIFPRGTTYGATFPLNNLFVVSVTEILLTFALIVVVLITYGRKFSTLAVSFFITIAINILAGSKISGASMNPARSFGPAVVSGSLQYFWIYFIMPLIGTVLGYLFIRFTRKDSSRAIK